MPLPVQRSLPWWPVLFALAGCNAPLPAGYEATGIARSPIKGGYDDATDNAVVEILWLASDTTTAVCTGSLIAPNLVLTAHHCVAQVDTGVDTSILCSSATFKSTDTAGDFLVSTKTVESPRLKDWHGVQQVITAGDGTVCGFDQAFLILDTNIAPSEAVPLIPRVDTDIAVDDVYSAVGFGTIDDQNGAGQRRRLDDLYVDCMGDVCDTTIVDASREWIGDHGICEGDSGGPALDDQGRIIGVTSRGAVGCESPIYGSVFGAAEFIKTTAKQAATIGNYTAPAWASGWPTDSAHTGAVGDPCTTAASCDSGYCKTDTSEPYCTRLCSDTATCPTGYECDTTGKEALCVELAKKGGCSVGSGPAEGKTSWLALSFLLALSGLVRRKK